jgi:hypothetical protein
MSATDDPRVFISYAYDSEAHKQQVLALATLLRTQLGIDARIDRWYEHERRDWTQWAIEQLDKADFVLAIASPAFRARGDGQAPADEGRGAQFEGALLRNTMMRDRNAGLRKILPVVLPGNKIDDIPEFLLPYSATRYVIERLTPDGIIDLRRALTGQPRHPLPPLGPRPAPLPPEETTEAPPPSRPREEGRRVDIRHSRVGKVIMGDYHDGRKAGPE